MKNLFKLVFLAALVTLSACQTRELNTKTSHTTGWNYFDKKTTNFQAIEGDNNTVPTGMIAIEGGSFTIGERDEFLTAPRNNATRTITVSSFYMDKYEITNLDWREYVQWVQMVFGTSSNDTAKNIVKSVLPDTTVWCEEMAYNDPYFIYYFRHPAYSFYPVVGVSWTQAMAYCQWRTDRVNELALIKAGELAVPAFNQIKIIDNKTVKSDWEKSNPGYQMESYIITDPDDPTKKDSCFVLPYKWIREKFVFNTDKYLYMADYTPAYGKHPLTSERGVARKAMTSDGILVVGYRLPTEAEWEFAAFAPVAGEDGFTIEGKLYPWSGYHPRSVEKKDKGQLQANFVRGRGDMMGMSHALNDGYVITAPVDAYAPNDFGLYNMAGNVNEWVMDVYRETSSMEVSEYNAFRGNIFKRPKYKDGKFVIDPMGCLEMTYDERDDKRDWKDGDIASRIETDYPLDTIIWANNSDTTKANTEWKIDPTDSLLAPRLPKESSVYKGGSWKDRVYWLNPSSRRYLDQNSSSNTIGFRCAMSKLGNNHVEK